MSHTTREQGFTTVELLISLFIAAAFITTGFQLFSVVMEDGNKARLRAAAASIANTTIQERMNAVGATCAPLPPGTGAVAIPTSQLPQATVTVTYTCPYGTNAKTTRVSAVVKYGTPQETVSESLDVSR